MGVPGHPYDEVVRPLYGRAREALPAGTRWFDAHTHVGDQDPDGLTATAPDIVAGLDRAGQDRALVFPLHEPGGYTAANAVVRQAAARSSGRLVALARIDPNRDAVAEARRGLEGGAVGFKLHPRSERFGLPHAAVEAVVALAHEARAPVLLHAGRGIPRLGKAAVDLARRYPGARIILAHAGISDLGWLAPLTAELANLYFDTAWWQASDLLHLFTHVPPARILYASDMPYGSGRIAGLAALRAGLAVGLGRDALAAVVGGQLARVVDGSAPLDLGPAPGAGALGPRRVAHERALAHLASAVHAIFRGGDPIEPLALALSACQTSSPEPALATIAALVEVALDERAGAQPGDRWPGSYATIAAQLVAGTPDVPV